MEDIRKLQTQLLQIQAENRKLKEQLHGLISLVRKAWTGSHSAAIDVAIIVGVSPPTLEISSITDELVAVPKPPAINNWFKLTIGLINKHYKERQTIIKARQLTYLHNREAYIDEQMGDMKCFREPKLGEVTWRTNSLRNIVEKENQKRKELRKEMDKNKHQEETTVFSSKGKNASGKKITFSNFRDKHNLKMFDETRIGDCLVVRSGRQSQPQLQEGIRRTPRARPKSAGSAMNKKAERCKRTTKKRPESAQTLSTSIRRKAPGRSDGLHNGRIEHQLDETEKDIALAIHLLQERLGIDEKGMYGKQFLEIKGKASVQADLGLVFGGVPKI